MQKIKTLFFVTCCILISSTPILAQNDGNSDGIIAQVGSVSLTQSHLDMVTQSMQPQVQAMINSNPEMKKELIDRWVEINLMAQEALATRLDQTPEVAVKINEMRNRILVEALISSRLDTQAPIPPEEIASFYEQHSNEFEQGEQVQAHHILIRLEEEAGREEQEKAKKTIDIIVEKLKKGETFADLAQQYSEDPGSKTNGGSLGYFGRGQMVKEFEDAAFATATGETSAPIKTSFGWHIIHVTDRRTPEKPTLEQVSKQIEARLRNERNEKALQALLGELKGKYPVMVK